MKTGKLILTFVLALGLTFQNCRKNCGVGPVPDYFNVTGIAGLLHSKEDDKGFDEFVHGHDTVKFAKYKGMTIHLEIDYIVSIKTFPANGFSFMSSSFACSPEEPGNKGSKNEKIDELYIITLNDFDNSHLKGDTINSIVELDKVSVDDFLVKQSGRIRRDYFKISLTRSPDIGNDYKVKVAMKLNTGEYYEMDSPTISFE